MSTIYHQDSNLVKSKALSQAIPLGGMVVLPKRIMNQLILDLKP